MNKPDLICLQLTQVALHQLMARSSMLSRVDDSNVHSDLGCKLSHSKSEVNNLIMDQDWRRLGIVQLYRAE